MLLVNEDVGHASLVGHLLEGILDRSAVVCASEVSGCVTVLDMGGVQLTDLIQLDDVWLDALLAQQCLGSLAVRAVRLGEDSCEVLSV